MKLNHLLMKTFASALLISLSNLTFANVVEHVTIVNHSAVNLKPTAEGFAFGCVGGSMPPMMNPVTPNEIRNIDVVFIKYSSSCQFTVLPQPNIILSASACHNVKANDVVIFTGNDSHHLECQVMA
jgi:hypothetical protein